MRIASTVRVFVAAFAFFATASLAFAQQKKEITIGLSSASFATGQLRIADQMGFFAKRGLSVRFVVTDGSSAALAALLAGSFDFVNVGTSELVLAAAKQLKVVSVATILGGFTVSLVLSKPVADKTGVSPNAPIKDKLKALDGRLIASATATAISSVVVKAAAEAAGANIRLTYMAQPGMQAALETGAIDGYMGAAPFWAMPVVKGTGVLWISGPKKEFPEEIAPGINAVLLAMKDYATANPDIVKNVTEALDEVSKAIQERPAEVKAVVAKVYPALDAALLDSLFSIESAAWVTKQSTSAEIAREVSIMKKLGLNVPGIENVDPKAVLYP
jgi:ABC-type nitrate/sulfonate/bicarbonate transport system substrate-binding protein